MRNPHPEHPFSVSDLNQPDKQVSSRSGQNLSGKAAEARGDAIARARVERLRRQEGPVQALPDDIFDRLGGE